MKMTNARKASIRNVVEAQWKEYPGHFGGALSKVLVDKDSKGATHVDYRVSMYQPMAHAERHVHDIQEQVYHILEGEGLVELDGEIKLVKKHDVIYIPPGVFHSISNSGLSDLIFIVVTTPQFTEG